MDFYKKYSQKTEILGFPSLMVAPVILILVVGCQASPGELSRDLDSEIEQTEEPTDPTPFPPGFSTPDAEKYADCLAIGGRWEVLGFSGPGCNLPTSDGGNPCSDSKACESACLADPDQVMSEDEIGQLIPDIARIDELNSRGEPLLGLCSSWKENFGCRIWLQEGQFVQMCVD